MEVGHHCSFKPCSRLDFLPFTCDGCKEIFCQEHNSPDDHSCDSVMKTGSEATPKSGTESATMCSVPECGKVGIVEVFCDNCGRVFCLSHRHTTDHNCSSQEAKQHSKDYTKPQRGIKTTPSIQTEGKRKGGKYTSLSAKVALMRLKQRAEGLSSIPDTEKAYFEIILPKEYGEASKPVFVSKVWTIGKVVDYLSQKYKLRNNNDKPNAKKLCLHSLDGMDIIMRQTVESLMETMPLGSTFYLEYES